MLYLLLFPLVVIGGLLIFLAPMFSRLIAKDYELGLVRLRAVLDPSAPKLDIRFPGTTEMPAMAALTMPFTAYHMADPEAGRFRCDLAVPVPFDTESGELTLKHFAGGAFEVTEVQGSYDFMELAWHAAMGHLRMVKRQWDRSRPAMEIYATGPDTAASDDELLTRICVPVKPKG